jgi:hypothetical protein
MMLASCSYLFLTVRLVIKKDEIFKRVRAKTLAGWIEDLAWEPDELGLDRKLNLSGSTGLNSKAETAADILQPKQEEVAAYTDEGDLQKDRVYLLLDVRLPEEFEKCKIKTGLYHDSFVSSLPINAFYFLFMKLLVIPLPC